MVYDLWMCVCVCVCCSLMELLEAAGELNQMGCCKLTTINGAGQSQYRRQEFFWCRLLPQKMCVSI